MKETTLTVQDLTIQTNDAEVCRNLDLKIASGEIVVLMGPNGSGKSSLVNTLMGHPAYEVSSGRILMGDTDITKEKPDERAKQGLFLSMQYPPEISGVTMSHFLHRAVESLSGEKVDVVAFSEGLEKLCKKYSINEALLDRDLNVGLSGGEKKISEVLQLAVLKPKIALLDEIDSGVDIDSLKKVVAILKDVAKDGCGLLLITHYPNILEHVPADRVYVMRNGSIAGEGGKELIGEVLENGFEGIRTEKSE